MHFGIRFGLSVSLSLGAIVQNVDALSQYSLTDLGANADAYSINAMGQVVGVSSNFGYLWTPTSPNAKTGTMKLLTTGISTASAINNYGQVAGTSTNLDTPFLWTPTVSNGTTGSMVNLTTSGAIDISINSYGQLAMALQGSSSFQPFLWTPTTPHGAIGAFKNLGNIALNQTASNSINSRGQIVGDSGNSASLWSPDSANSSTGSMIGLGNLLQSDAVSSFGAAINDSGQVAGSSDSPEGESLFLWTPTTPNAATGSMADLGTLPGTEPEPLGMNNAGAIVGQATNTFRAFIWISSDGLSYLTPLLDNSGAGWTLNEARSINDNGQIVGYGSYDPDGPGGVPSSEHAFLLTPVPEPTSLAILFTSAAIVSPMLRRRRGDEEASLRRHPRR